MCKKKIHKKRIRKLLCKREKNQQTIVQKRKKSTKNLQKTKFQNPQAQGLRDQGQPQESYGHGPRRKPEQTVPLEATGERQVVGWVQFSQNL